MNGQNARKGFSLIEAAIVLAVIGLVIGGIWVAAAKVKKDYNVNKDVEIILISIEKLRGLYRGIVGNHNFDAAYAKQMGIISNIYINSDRNAVTNSGVKLSYFGVSEIQIYAQLYEVDYKYCLYLIPRLSINKKSLKEIRITDESDNTFIYTSFPLGADLIKNDFPSSRYFYITLFFYR